MSLSVGAIVGISFAAAFVVGGGIAFLSKKTRRNKSSFDINSSRVEKNTSSSNPLLFLHPSALRSNASGRRKTKKRRSSKKR